MAEESDAENFPPQSRLFDAHCHPTDTMSSIKEIASMNASALTVMATRAQDQDLVAEVAEAHGLNSAADLGYAQEVSTNWRQIIPSFGWHPWFSYQLYDDFNRSETGQVSNIEKTAHYQKVLTPTPEDVEYLSQLPEPRLLSTFIEETRQRLQKFPLALIGEVGIDRAFRLPDAWLPGQIESRDPSLTPGGREGRRLSPYKVEQNHQVSILLAQLKLAGELQRAVSVHGVQAHGILYEALAKTWKGYEKEVMSNTEKKRRRSVSDAHDAELDDASAEKIPVQIGKSYPPRICLHSYSGPPEFLKQYLHPSVPVDFYFSFSIVINFSTSASAKTEDVIREIPEDRILIESDMHIAGHEMDNKLEEIARKVCNIKEWTIHDGLDILATNWNCFIFGKYPS